MICYKDKTFCCAKCANYKCDRKLTYGQSMEAEKLNLNIAFSDLSETCDKYIEGTEDNLVSCGAWFDSSGILDELTKLSEEVKLYDNPPTNT